MNISPKLYIFEPPGCYDKIAFYVMAISKEKAIEAINKHISEENIKNRDSSLEEPFIEGWSNGEYTCRELTLNEVVAKFEHY